MNSPTVSSPGSGFADLMPGIEAFQAFADAYGQDPDLRSRVDAEPKAVLAERGVELPTEVDVRILVNTGDVFYFVFPPDPNAALTDEMLGQVAGGKTLSTAGSAGTGGSVGCVCGTASTASTAGSVGTAGSAGGLED